MYRASLKRIHVEAPLELGDLCMWKTEKQHKVSRQFGPCIGHRSGQYLICSTRGYKVHGGLASDFGDVKAACSTCAFWFSNFPRILPEAPPLVKSVEVHHNLSPKIPSSVVLVLRLLRCPGKDFGGTASSQKCQ